MLLTISGGALNTAAAWAARIAPSNPAGAAIMGGVLLDAGDHGLELRATDFDTFGSVTTDAQTSEPGKAVVSARLLAAIAKTLGAGDQATLETGARGLELRVKRYKASLPLMNIDDWPKWPDIGDPIGTIEASGLSRALSRVLPAASDDGTLPILTGVEFTFADTLTMAATDKYRIAAAELPWQPTLDSPSRSLTIPSLLLATMRDAIDNATADVTVYSDGNTVTLSGGRHRITGRLIDGKFVAWRSLMKQPEPATVTTVNVVALARAVKQVSAAVEGKADQLRLGFTPDGIEVALAADPDSSNDLVEPSDFTFTGQPITIGVSCHYLRDALTCIDAPKVELRLNADPTKPFLLHAVDKDGNLLGDGYRHLLIATRLKELVAA